MNETDELVKSLVLEFRRGLITLGVLSRLSKPAYGYALVEDLEQKGIPIEPGTLYPLLRRLESQGLLKSEWETTGSKPRKYYELTETGKTVYTRVCAEWAEMAATMNNLTNEGETSHE